jgi:hypothetical protein
MRTTQAGLVPVLVYHVNRFADERCFQRDPDPGRETRFEFAPEGGVSARRGLPIG